MSTLGAEYQKCLDVLAVRMLWARSGSELDALVEKQEQLHAPLRDMLNKEWGVQVAGYQEAVDALTAANAAGEKAIEDLDKIAVYITRLGQAITILAKFAAALP